MDIKCLECLINSPKKDSIIKYQDNLNTKLTQLIRNGELEKTRLNQSLVIKREENQVLAEENFKFKKRSKNNLFIGLGIGIVSTSLIYILVD